MCFWAPPCHTDKFWSYGPRPFGPFLKRKSHFCNSESTWKIGNNTSENFFLSLWQLRYIFCAQSLDRWPMFIFIKMTHGAMCTRLWVTWLWNVHTTYTINSDRHSKKSIFSEASQRLSNVIFNVPRAQWHFLVLLVETVRTVVDEEFTCL